ncbi:hypothetical protein [Ammoniphilus oxalaticus]|uniref:hypothetical protein n=1 Tax=Ammoniphilus oxalaticus TaxID=66863 RepID=UPI0011C44532|nr:hypothetical protein [Ammoniphilus oxalaticus]
MKRHTVIGRILFWIGLLCFFLGLGIFDYLYMPEKPLIIVGVGIAIIITADFFFQKPKKESGGE